MKYLPDSAILRIQQYGPELNGVFGLSDLQVLLGTRNTATLHNRINRLIALGLLKRFRNSLYTMDGFSRETLSARINAQAYFSMGTVLAANGFIGTVPEKRLYAVKPGRSRCYKHADLVIEHLGISESLYFGFTLKNGFQYADSEKAFLDTLYYYMKGRRFSFNPTVDVDVGRLNRTRMNKYLGHYKNERFKTFCRNLINGRDAE